MSRTEVYPDRPMPTKYRRQRLTAVEDELRNLIRDLHRTGGLCEHCGAYRAVNDAEQKAEVQLTNMLATVQEWQQESWSNE